MNDEENFVGQEPRPASAALPPVSVAFGSMGSMLMAIGPADSVHLQRIRDIAAHRHEQPAHIGCAPNDHDFVATNAITGQEAMFNRSTYGTLVYCRKCPYHYFPQQNE